jgi:uncharacterized protein YhaN
LRFARLAAPAFGPFTDFALDLSAGGADLHLIFGPNEAGKSSLLRAIGDLLYGIPARTGDGFLHDYGDLRIAAILEGCQGQRLAVQRRKGNKNTLLDVEGAPLPDDALSGLLGVVDRDFFTTVFALDADSLRTGAQSLLQGQGDIGQALFSASLAGTPVHRILDALEGDAATLFDGRRTKGVSIRPALGDYKASLDASRDATVRPEAWEQALQAVQSAQAARDALEAELRRRSGRRDWVQRCLDALPVIGALAEQERLRTELPPLPDLLPERGPGFVQLAEQAVVDRDAARARLTELARSIARLEGRVAENRPDARVLARAGEIEAVHEQLAVQREWRNEHAALATEQARLATELAADMRELGVDGDPAAVESLRAGAEAVLALREAASAREDAAGAAQAQRTKLTERRQALTQLEQQLAAEPAPDPSVLRDALTRTQAAAQLAVELPQLDAALAAAARECVHRHQLLPGAPADAADTAALPVPTAAVLRRFGDEDARIAAQLAAAGKDADEADARDRDLAADLARLERDGTLPSERDLDTARAQRDGIWARVVAVWRDGEPDPGPPEPPLAQAYAQSVRAADDIADRLRAESETVARAESLRQQRRAAAAAAEHARQAGAEAESARADWQQRWRDVWAPCGVTPDTPQAMQEWRDHWLALREAVKAQQSAQADVTRARAAVDAALTLLRPLQPAHPGDDLPTLRAAAEREVRAADEARGAREQRQDGARKLRDEIETLAAGLPALEHAEAAALATWQERCRALGLPQDAAAATVLELMDRRNALVALYDRWHARGEQLARRDRDVADYAARVHGLADALELPAGTVEAREAALWQALEAARAHKVRQEAAQRDLSDERERLPAARGDLESAEERLAELRAQAGAADEPALTELLAGLKRRHAIDAEIERRRQGLYSFARGEPLDAFIERVRAEDADTLAAERDGLDQAIAGLQQERDQALKALHEANAEKNRLQQSGLEAAAHLQDAKNTASQIRRDAQRYLRLQLAVHLLRGQIERFRRESQGPLLARAGELFRRATAGSFDGLGTGFAGDDTPVLVGLRGDTRVDVTGMSDGTRDQLYLALRIAAIERHLAHHEPMPMVLDDLLMTFDDRRCLAILPILRELAEQTQVLLFTHHRHLRELAREALGDDGFHRHTLGTRDVDAP